MVGAIIDLLLRNHNFLAIQVIMVTTTPSLIHPQIHVECTTERRRWVAP